MKRFTKKLVGNRLKIAASLRKAFNVKEEQDFWETLFESYVLKHGEISFAGC